MVILLKYNSQYPIQCLKMMAKDFLRLEFYPEKLQNTLLSIKTSKFQTNIYLFKSIADAIVVNVQTIYSQFDRSALIIIILFVWIFIIKTYRWYYSNYYYNFFKHAWLRLIPNHLPPIWYCIVEVVVSFF